MSFLRPSFSTAGGLQTASNASVGTEARVPDAVFGRSVGRVECWLPPHSPPWMQLVGMTQLLPSRDAAPVRRAMQEILIVASGLAEDAETGERLWEMARRGGMDRRLSQRALAVVQKAMDKESAQLNEVLRQVPQRSRVMRGFRPSDGMYLVDLPFGRASLGESAFCLTEESSGPGRPEDTVAEPSSVPKLDPSSLSLSIPRAGWDKWRRLARAIPRDSDDERPSKRMRP